jgi:hypothetical protein
MSLHTIYRYFFLGLYEGLLTSPALPSFFLILTQLNPVLPYTIHIDTVVYKWVHNENYMSIQDLQVSFYLDKFILMCH